MARTKTTFRPKSRGSSKVKKPKYLSLPLGCKGDNMCIVRCTTSYRSCFANFMNNPLPSHIIVKLWNWTAQKADLNKYERRFRAAYEDGNAHTVIAKQFIGPLKYMGFARRGEDHAIVVFRRVWFQELRTRAMGKRKSLSCTVLAKFDLLS